MADESDRRYASLSAKLERDFPGINNPTSERYYYARLTARDWKEIFAADRAKAEANLAAYIATLNK